MKGKTMTVWEKEQARPDPPDVTFPVTLPTSSEVKVL